MSEEDKFIFENLKVYQLSREITIELIKIAVKFPYQYSRIRDQLIGAVLSIPLNIAEGCGRYSPKDKINFYKIARSSNYELVAILDICNELKLLNKHIWFAKILSISKMLTKLIQSQNK